MNEAYLLTISMAPLRVQIETMKKEFFSGTTRGMRIAFVGFLVALTGVVVGFFGFHIEARWLAVTGFGFTVIGVLIGFAGVLTGWVLDTKGAVAGSTQAAEKLRSRFFSRRKS